MWRLELPSPYLDPFDQYSTPSVQSVGSGRILTPSNTSGEVFSNTDSDQEALLPVRPRRFFPLSRVSNNFPDPGPPVRRSSLPTAVNCFIRFDNETAIVSQIQEAQQARKNSMIRKSLAQFLLAVTFLLITLVILVLKLFC